MVRVTLRTVRVVAVLAVAVVALASCAPGPAPTPTPSAPFATEDEAFAAAEATYRAYVDALNQRRESRESEVDPQSFLVGDALNGDLETERQLADANVTLIGPSVATSIAPRSLSEGMQRAELAVCLDSSQVRVVDIAGTDVTPIDRPNKLALSIGLVLSSGSYLITKSATDEARDC